MRARHVSRSPFAADSEAALAAHERQAVGQVVVLLADDPDDPKVLAAERQRKRIQEWHRRKRLKAAQAEYARRAKEAGWDLTYVEEPGLIHVYPLISVVPEARRAWRTTVAFLDR